MEMKVTVRLAVREMIGRKYVFWGMFCPEGGKMR